MHICNVEFKNRQFGVRVASTSEDKILLRNFIYEVRTIARLMINSRTGLYIVHEFEHEHGLVAVTILERFVQLNEYQIMELQDLVARTLLEQK